MLRLGFLGLLLGLVACGAKQEPRGAAFCDSYERNFTGACRQHCEADVELGDAEGVKTCQAKCAADLKGDDTYADSCVSK
jgi:hypothetical protein